MEHISKILGSLPEIENIPAPRIYEVEEQVNSPEETRAETLISLGVTDLAHDFKTIERVKGFIPALDACKAMAEGIAEFQLVMIYGGVGNGKTRLCEAVVISMFDRGLRVKRDRWSDVVRTMKSHFNNRGNITYEEYFTHLRSRERIIFDDVGSGSTLGSWEWGELEDIVDYRSEKKLFTIITTNLEIKAFPVRISSRFRDKSRARLILNEAPDYRPLIKGGKVEK